MRLEFTEKEIESFVREAVEREFPQHKIDDYNQTTYGHLIIVLKRRSVPDASHERPAPGYLDDGQRDLNDE